MIVSILDSNEIAWFEYLSPKLQRKIISDVISCGRRLPGHNRNAYEISDDSSIAQLLRAIEDIVDRQGIFGIYWINKELEDDYRKIESIRVGNVKLDLKKLPSDEFLKKYLIAYTMELEI